MTSDVLQRVNGPVKFGIWGATGAGKTTYLGALRVAMLRSARSGTAWRISGMTDTASSFQDKRWQELVEKHEFPPSSEGVTQLSWLISGGPSKSQADNQGARTTLFRGRRMVDSSEQVEFILEILDVAGGAYLNIASGDETVEKAVAHLAESAGLLYLFDPIREVASTPEDQRNLGFLQRVIEELMRRAAGRPGGLDQGRLPHHVAVCIAKFDHPAVFDLAMNDNWVSFDSGNYGLPRVAEEHARLFFDRLARHMPLSDADLISDFLETYFHEDRVRYFVMSSIGFHLGPDGRFDPSDYQNTDSDRIRGPIYPLNVLEPLIWLHQSSQRRSRSSR